MSTEIAVNLTKFMHSVPKHSCYLIIINNLKKSQKVLNQDCNKFKDIRVPKTFVMSQWRLFPLKFRYKFKTFMQEWCNG